MSSALETNESPTTNSEEQQAVDSASAMTTSIKADLTVDVAAEKEEHPDAGEINAADEVEGLKLALIILGLCFSNILTGLVSLLRHHFGGCR